MTSTTVVDDANLSPQDADTLHAWVNAAGLLDPRPPAASPRSGGPDRFSYELTVDADGRRRTLRVGQADLSPALRGLLEFAQSVPGRTQHLAPPGGARGEGQ